MCEFAAARCREGGDNITDVGKEAVTTGGGGAPQRIRLALGRKPPPLPLLCDPGGRRVQKGEMRDS